MFTTSTPHVVADVDDDEFDWEAAVREIDVACEGTAKASTSTSTHRPDPPKKSSGVTRQSTLDSFIGRKPSVENRPYSPHRLDNSFIAQKSTVEDQPSTSHRVDNSKDVGGGGDFIEDDKVSYAHVDLEADKVSCAHVDLEAAKTWIYPVNIPVRDYQLSITETALFANTLVSLPTGLGKTLIAAVVMYNYFRWFPEGKIVFTAPSRPLVMQQIEACHNIVGIPQEWAIDMTGQMSPSKRVYFWKAKRVFFVTPQVLEKDIQSGICLVKHLVCLVIDEAHRATGNYSYCVAVRELMSVPVQLRILALTATPGSKQQTIQSVINNLYISKLEYRTENDHDVSPYMHNRKLDLVKVEMGKDATDIDSRLCEAMQPFAIKLSGLGLLHSKNCQMLSPHHLLTCRDKYRQAPPQDLQMKDVEGYFGVVITFSHIRKLLSSHGIKSAYELLEDKLKQGCFARFMNRNDGIWEAKRLMEQNLSHGAPYPKLLKMREILIDHFKKNNPQSSRVIIFSNFRGSVRDIMDSLSSIGELVKAAEFIGQSSGKTSKGQTQKVQQAVLQKFRAGGYNVIIATSIGEEGLDIMEVDLVICFDANISPLRMIQRMGRTGRKHDGRVVVLACEGTELKGYYRKQATSKSIMKHMHNGGMHSFDFHSSPRMIPHICKPEVQFVKFSIEQFLPRGRKWKADSLARPTFENKLSDPETELIAKYFHSSEDSSWKPSLIAFPLFQAYPSRVHKVMHSFRTHMLIDTMQHLQGLSFFNDYNALPVEVQTEPTSRQCLEAAAVAQDGITEKEQTGCYGSQKAHHSKRVPDSEPLPTVFSSCKEKQHVPNLPNTIPSHCFLFGTNFVCLDAFGMVSIKSVPSFPFLREVPFCKSTMANRMEVVNGAKENTFPSKTSSGDNGKLTVQIKSSSTDLEELRDADYNFLLNSRLCNSDIHAEKMQHEVEGVILLTPSPKGYVVKSDESVVETPPSTRKGIPLIFGNVSTSDYNDTDLSPRLTNMLENGLIPESPLCEAGDHFITKNIVCMPASSEHVNSGLLRSSLTGAQANKVPKNIPQPAEHPHCKVGSEWSYPVPVSPVLPVDTWSKASSAENTCNVKICSSLRARECMSTSFSGVLRTPLEMNNFVDIKGHISDSPINEELHTPIINLTNNCSEDWRFSSGEASKSTMTAPKFKRLKKHGEFSRRMSSKHLKENSNGPISDIDRNFIAIARDGMKHKKVKDMTNVNLFIEVEAEVSSDAEVSDDEEEDKDTNSYDDSFIDDRVNLTGAGTQAEVNGIDMMAIYRRSLLTQSPRVVQPNCSIDFNPDSMPSKTDETGSCSSGKTGHSLQTPQTGLHSQSALNISTSCQRDRDQISLVTLPDETSVTKIENRKRKLDFHQVRHGPESPLQPQRLFQSDAVGEASLQGQYETNRPGVDMFSDDVFYEGLDLDELEEQATKLLKNKSGLPIQTKQCDITDDLLSSPSFDLGI